MKKAITAILVASLGACASLPEDRDCRRAADILEDPSYYKVCLIQKGLL